MSALATSPATRPTPTTEIGPSGSRSPEPNAASATPTIFSGIRSTTPAVRDTCSQISPGTAETGCWTISGVPLVPRPALSVTLPASSVVGLPSSS